MSLRRCLLVVLGVALASAAQAADVWGFAEKLGAAYAGDAHATWGGVTHDAGIAVTAANVAAQRERVIAGLSVGYAAKGEAFRAIPWSDASDILRVHTAAGSSPEEAVAKAVVPGAAVYGVTWKVGGASLPAFAVVASDGRLAFDSLICLPVVRAPVFSVHQP